MAVNSCRLHVRVGTWNARDGKRATLWDQAVYFHACSHRPAYVQSMSSAADGRMCSPRPQPQTDAYAIHARSHRLTHVQSMPAATYRRMCLHARSQRPLKSSKRLCSSSRSIPNWVQRRWWVKSMLTRRSLPLCFMVHWVLCAPCEWPCAHA